MEGELRDAERRDGGRQELLGLREEGLGTRTPGSEAGGAGGLSPWF